MDNLNSHPPQSQAEIEIGTPRGSVSGTRRILASSPRREVCAWNRRMNHDRVEIKWKFSRKAARRKFWAQKENLKRSGPENTGQAR